MKHFFTILFVLGNGILLPLYAQKVTFASDITPIIHQNCSPCHREGETAPFPLISYEDVAKRAMQVQYVTESRYMPPWKADPHYRSFSNEKRLSEREIQLIKTWVSQKMPKGKLKTVQTPDFDNHRWKLLMRC